MIKKKVKWPDWTCFTFFFDFWTYFTEKEKRGKRINLRFTAGK